MSKRWTMGVLGAAALAAAAVRPVAALPIEVFYTDFESGIPAELSGTALSSDPTLGSYHGRYTLDGSTTLTLSGLPAHSRLSLAFDLYLFNTWDGNDPTYGLDFFSLSGDVLFSETFTNHQEEGQTYAGKPDETLGPAGMRQTQVYRGLDPTGSGDQFLIAHSADTFTVTFGGPTTQSDEQWGVDNIRVSIDSLASGSAAGPSVAEPATLALLGLALVGLGLWRKAPSWRRALARAVRGYRP